jgi:DNA modification methylase
MQTDTIICIGDCRKNIKRIANDSIQTVVTSPPYFALRKYGDSGQEVGSEENVSDYVSDLVGLFSDVMTKLKDSGSLWVNIGDTYAHAMSANTTHGKGTGRSGQNIFRERKQPEGFKSKSLMGVPWRFAHAMQDAGWILRQDIIWEKPAPRPESVKDRCTRSHEYVFHFTKSPDYYFDTTVSREPGVNQESRRMRSVWKIAPERNSAHIAPYPKELVKRCVLPTSRPGDLVLDPFHGSGTTARVANELGRNYVGFELYYDFVEQWRDLEGAEISRDFEILL